MHRVLQSSRNVKEKNKSALASVLSEAFGDQVKQDLETQTKAVLHREAPVRNDKYIDMMFYSPFADDKLINRLVAWTTAQDEYMATGEKLSKQFAHVEISFPFSIDNKCFEDEQTMGFSIVQNKTVSLRLKHWRPEYTAIRLFIDSGVYLKLYQTCILLNLQKIRFDQIGMY